MAGEIEQPFTINFEGDSVLSDSISFGRFETESLSWERRSSFSHNRYLEEVEKYSKPGSVNEKKAYFEAHFKKRGGLLGQNSAESYSIENGASEKVNQGTDIEIKNMDNHNCHFDDCSVSPQNHGDHEVTEFEMSNPGISFPNPKFETSFSSVGGSIYGALSDVSAEINEEGDSGENKFSTFVGDEPEVKINQKTNKIEMNKNVPSEAMESGPKTDPVKKAGKSCSGSQQTVSVKMISKRETKTSKSQANIRQSRRNIFGNELKTPEKVSNKSKGETPQTICTEVHSSKTGTSRTHAVHRTPKAEGSKVLKGKAIVESRSGAKVQTSRSYSSPSKLESRSYQKTTTRQSQTVNSAMQDTGKSASASHFRSSDLAERRKQGKADAEIKRLQKNLDIRSKPIPSSYGAVRPASDGKKAVFSSTIVRNTLRKSTAAGLSSHSLLGKDVDSSASEAPNRNTSKNTSCHSAVHVEASENSSISLANQEFLPEAVSGTENKKKKDQVKEKEPNVHKSRVSENCRMSKQGVVEGKQKVGARRSIGLMGRRDIKGVAGSGMGRLAVGVTS